MNLDQLLIILYDCLGYMSTFDFWFNSKSIPTDIQLSKSITNTIMHLFR